MSISRCGECEVPELSAKVFIAKRYHKQMEEYEQKMDTAERLFLKTYQDMSPQERVVFAKEEGYLG